jgi:putative endopeptidase
VLATFTPAVWIALLSKRKATSLSPPTWQRINKITDLNGIVNELVYERVNGIGSPLFGFGVGQDDKHVDKYIVSLRQGGTSLPDRDNYLKDDARSKKIQDALKTYITTLFTLTGTNADVAAKNAGVISTWKKHWLNHN